MLSVKNHHARVHEMPLKLQSEKRAKVRFALQKENQIKFPNNNETILNQFSGSYRLRSTNALNIKRSECDNGERASHGRGS